MEQTILNPVEIIAYFESGNGILCDLDRIRALMRQTQTQHEMFLFREMVGRPVEPMALHPIHVFTASRPSGRMRGARRAA